MKLTIVFADDRRHCYFDLAGVFFNDTGKILQLVSKNETTEDVEIDLSETDFLGLTIVAE